MRALVRSDADVRAPWVGHGVEDVVARGVRDEDREWRRRHEQRARGAHERPVRPAPSIREGRAPVRRECQQDVFTARRDAHGVLCAARRQGCVRGRPTRRLEPGDPVLGERRIVGRDSREDRSVLATANQRHGAARVEHRGGPVARRVRHGPRKSLVPRRDVHRGGRPAHGRTHDPPNADLAIAGPRRDRRELLLDPPRLLRVGAHPPDDGAPGHVSIPRGVVGAARVLPGCVVRWRVPPWRCVLWRCVLRRCVARRDRACVRGLEGARAAPEQRRHADRGADRSLAVRPEEDARGHEGGEGASEARGGHGRPRRSETMPSEAGIAYGPWPPQPGSCSRNSARETRAEFREAGPRGRALRCASGRSVLRSAPTPPRAALARKRPPQAAGGRERARGLSSAR